MGSSWQKERSSSGFGQPPPVCFLGTDGVAPRHESDLIRGHRFGDRRRHRAATAGVVLFTRYLCLMDIARSHLHAKGQGTAEAHLPDAPAMGQPPVDPTRDARETTGDRFSASNLDVAFEIEGFDLRNQLADDRDRLLSLPDPKVEVELDALLAVEVEQLRRRLERLSAVERAVISLRFGLYGDEWTVPRLAAATGRRPKSIARIERRALRKLRALFQIERNADA